MPAKPPPLNARQLQVLEWIRDGCPDGVVEGHSHKITAVALQNRKLVRVNRKGGQWTATITEAGLAYLRDGGWPTTPAAPPATTSRPSLDIALSRATRQSNVAQRKAPSRMPPERADISVVGVPVPARLALRRRHHEPVGKRLTRLQPLSPRRLVRLRAEASTCQGAHVGVTGKRQSHLY